MKLENYQSYDKVEFFPISTLIKGGGLVDQLLKPNHQKKQKTVLTQAVF